MMLLFITFLLFFKKKINNRYKIAKFFFNKNNNYKMKQLKTKTKKQKLQILDSKKFTFNLQKFNILLKKIIIIHC